MRTIRRCRPSPLRARRRCPLMVECCRRAQLARSPGPRDRGSAMKSSAWPCSRAVLLARSSLLGQRAGPIRRRRSRGEVKLRAAQLEAASGAAGGRTRTSSTPSSTPGRRHAAPARRTSRTWSRCIGSIAGQGPGRSSRCRSTIPTDKAAVAEAEKFLKEKKADVHQHLARRELRRRVREAEHQRDSRRIHLRSRRQGSETIHHGRSRTTSSLTTKSKRRS